MKYHLVKIIESTKDIRSERIKNRYNGNILAKFCESWKRLCERNSRVRSIALRFYNAGSHSGSDGPTMSVPMARGTLCQATERILIITRTRYISSGVYADNGEVFENERPAIYGCAYLRDSTNRSIARITSQEFRTRVEGFTRE